MNTAMKIVVIHEKVGTKVFMYGKSGQRYSKVFSPFHATQIFISKRELIAVRHAQCSKSKEKPPNFFQVS